MLGRRSECEVLDRLLELGGLALAEEHGVVYRDLKPENIMVSAQAWVKIADFGIAKATSETRTIANLTTIGTTFGTPRYMAPERAMARRSVRGAISTPSG